MLTPGQVQHTELESIYERYMTCLRTYAEHNFPNEPNRVEELLVRLPEVSTILRSNYKSPKVSNMAIVSSNIPIVSNIPRIKAILKNKNNFAGESGGRTLIGKQDVLCSVSFEFYDSVIEQSVEDEEWDCGNVESVDDTTGNTKREEGEKEPLQQYKINICKNDDLVWYSYTSCMWDSETV